MPEEPRRRGRPTIVPGERSVQHCVVLEESLYRRVVRIANDQRTDAPDIIRAAIRRYVDEILPVHQTDATL